MPDTLVSLRLDSKLKNAALRKAKQDGLSFSDCMRTLLKGYAEGILTISVSTRQKKTLRH